MSLKGIVKKIDNRSISVILNQIFYEKSAIYAASYKMTDKCTVVIDSVGENKVEINIELKNEGDVELLEDYACDFCNEVLN